MTTETIEKPNVADPTVGEPTVAHIITKDSQMRGYIYGEEIIALCGERFIPTRDPNRYPLCGACKETLSHFMNVD